ncbi:uncharacterized protein [Malus domestica]|uniref:uncharacterized protein n=1 Tax=Malus domestica TaxID=3750 RepID=UPI003974B170
MANANENGHNLASLIPRFGGDNYDYWSNNMKVLLKALELWNIVETGYEETDNEAALTQAQMNTLRENRKKDSKALFHIYQTIEMQVYERVAKAENAKQAWDMIENAYRGKEKVKKVRLQSLRKEFEKLEMKEDETINDYFIKVTSIVNQMASNGEILEDARIVEKILRSLLAKFDYVMAAIEESNDISTFSMEKFDHGQVRIGDDRAYKIEGIGEVSFKSKSGTIEKVSEVYYVPGLKSNLLSMGHLLRKGYDIRLRGDFCVLKKEDKFVAKVGLAANNLFPLKLQTTKLSCFVSAEKEVSKLWHDRYGHLNYGSLKLLSNKRMVHGLPQIDPVDGVCEDCQFGKVLMVSKEAVGAYSL